MIHDQYGNNKMAATPSNVERDPVIEAAFDDFDRQMHLGKYAQEAEDTGYTSEGSASPSSGIAALVLAPALLIALITHMAGWWV